MRKLMIALGMVGILASCTQTERGTAIGATSGAIIGGVVSNSWQGAAIGAAAGGVAGALIGHSREHRGYCIYRDRYGRKFEARCR
ncbi:glycine zipper 2TM domain-containing protein [Rhizobium sp. KVB221]|uniref:Glycine zipper 2TM domain-containing protein n=1 Tax=Rhizobium setariae TaxID=2801340 RepID=A0A936YQV5_9HYPH|nr:YMGG-like glycine zipper-containing protein [Rhizobium setariae]MBL0371146.1 glycine zipper 2TM domain-containing protein [Rhizobium setariae]